MTSKRDKAYARSMTRTKALATFGDFFESLDPDDTFDAEIMPSGQVRALAETWARRE